MGCLCLPVGQFVKKLTLSVHVLSSVQFSYVALYASLHVRLSDVSVYFGCSSQRDDVTDRVSRAHITRHYNRAMTTHHVRLVSCCSRAHDVCPRGGPDVYSSVPLTSLVRLSVRTRAHVTCHAWSPVSIHATQALRCGRCVGWKLGLNAESIRLDTWRLDGQQLWNRFRVTPSTIKQMKYEQFHVWVCVCFTISFSPYNSKSKPPEPPRYTWFTGHSSKVSWFVRYVWYDVSWQIATKIATSRDQACDLPRSRPQWTFHWLCPSVCPHLSTPITAPVLFNSRTEGHGKFEILCTIFQRHA